MPDPLDPKKVLERAQQGFEGGFQPGDQSLARRGGAAAQKRVAAQHKANAAREQKALDIQTGEELKTQSGILKQQKAIHGRKIAAFQKEGMRFQTDIETGQKVPERDAYGRQLWEKGPLGDPVKGTDGKFTQTFRNELGDPKKTELMPEEDPKTGEQFFERENEFGEKVRETVGVNKKTVQLNQIGREIKKATLRKGQLAIKRKDFDVNWDPVKQEYKKVRDDLDTLTGKKKGKEAPYKRMSVTDKDGNTSLEWRDSTATPGSDFSIKDPTKFHAWRAEIEQAKRTMGVIKLPYLEAKEQHDTLEKSEFDADQHEARLKQKKGRIELGLLEETPFVERATGEALEQAEMVAGNPEAQIIAERLEEETVARNRAILMGTGEELEPETPQKKAARAEKDPGEQLARDIGEAAVEKKPFKLTIPKKGEVFDPESAEYDYASAKAAGLGPDDTGHWPSRDPKTGLILKGSGHPTFHKTVAGEKKAGMEIFTGSDGRQYSRPKNKKATPATLFDRMEDKISFARAEDDLIVDMDDEKVWLQDTSRDSRIGFVETTRDGQPALFMPHTDVGRKLFVGKDLTKSVLPTYIGVSGANSWTDMDFAVPLYQAMKIQNGEATGPQEMFAPARDENFNEVGGSPKNNAALDKVEGMISKSLTPEEKQRQINAIFGGEEEDPLDATLTKMANGGILSDRQYATAFQSLLGYDVTIPDWDDEGQFDKWMAGQEEKTRKLYEDAEEKGDKDLMGQIKAQYLEAYSVSYFRHPFFPRDEFKRAYSEVPGAGRLEAIGKGATSVAGSIFGLVGGLFADAGIGMYDTVTLQENRGLQHAGKRWRDSNMVHGTDYWSGRLFDESTKAWHRDLLDSLDEVKRDIDIHDAGQLEELLQKVGAKSKALNKSARIIPEGKISSFFGDVNDEEFYNFAESEDVKRLLKAYHETGNKVYFELFQDYVMSDPTKRLLDQEAQNDTDEEVKAKGLLGRLGGSVAEGFSAGADAPISEVAIEVGVMGATWGVGNLAKWGAKGAANVTAKVVGRTRETTLMGRGARWAQKSGARFRNGVVDDWKGTTKAGSLAKGASSFQRARVAVAKVAPRTGVGMVLEGGEEVLAELQDPTATAEDFTMAFIMGLLGGPAIVAMQVPSKLAKMGMAPKVRARQNQKFADWWNKGMANIPGFQKITPDQADIARSLVDTQAVSETIETLEAEQEVQFDLSGRITDIAADHKAGKIDDSRAEAQILDAANQLSESTARIKDLEASISSTLLMPVEAINEVNALPAEQAAFYQAAVKAVVQGEASLLPAERKALTEKMTEDGREFWQEGPDGAAELTDAALEQIEADAPMLGAVLGTRAGKTSTTAAPAAAPSSAASPAAAPAGKGSGAATAPKGKPKSPPTKAQTPPATKAQAEPTLEKRVAQVEAAVASGKLTREQGNENIAAMRKAEAKKGPASKAQRNFVRKKITQAQKDSPLIRGRVKGVTKSIPAGIQVNIATGNIEVNMETLGKRLDKVKEKDWDKRVSEIIDEEIIHVAQVDAMREIAGGNPKAFQEHYAEIWEEMGKEQQKAVKATYGRSTTAPGWQLAAEGIRIYVQQRARGEHTELTKALDGKFGPRAIALVKKMLEKLREFATKGVKGEVLATIKAVEAILAENEQTSPPVNEGKRFSIYETKINGEDRFAVQSKEERGNGAGDTLHKTRAEAESFRDVEMAREEERVNSLKRLDAEEKEAAETKEESESLGGFEEGLTPMQKGSKRKALAKKFNFAEGEFSRRDIIRKRVDSGAVISTVDGKRVLENKDESFLGEDKLTKVGLDYAQWLLGEQTPPKSEAPEGGPPPGPAPKAEEESLWDPSDFEELKGIVGLQSDDSLQTSSPEDQYAADIPEENTLALLNFSKKSVGKGVNTPELLAKQLSQVPGLSKFSAAIWGMHIAASAKLGALPSPNWAEIYGEIDKPARPEDTSGDGSTSGHGKRGGEPTRDSGEGAGSGDQSQNEGDPSGSSRGGGAGTGDAGSGTESGGAGQTDRKSGGDNEGSSEESGGKADGSSPVDEREDGGTPHEPPRNVEDRDFVVPDDFTLPKGPKARIEANFAAAELMVLLEKEGRNATPEEKSILSQYTGWGAFKEGFNDVSAVRWAKLQQEATAISSTRNSKSYQSHQAWAERWGALHDRLKSTFTEKEYRAMSKSIQNAHFTDPPVIDAMWKMLERLGFKGGQVLEPSSGTGLFIGRQPAHLKARSRWEAVELDDITARIASKLYPEARINSVSSMENREIEGQGFQDSLIGNNTQDVVITNVPFYEIGPAESEAEFGLQLNLHNYFIARALRKVKAGGIVAVITSNSSMDNNLLQREILANGADLIGAARLPNTSFKGNAGTEVTTDILILRKQDGRHDVPSQNWLNTREVAKAPIVVRRPTTMAQGRETPVSLHDWMSSIPGNYLFANEATQAAWQDWKVRKAKTGEKWEAMREALHDSLSRDTPGLEMIAPISVNEYFSNNPSHALGSHSLEGSMYRENQYALTPHEEADAGSLSDQLATFADSLPQDIMGNTDQVTVNEGPAIADPRDKDSSYVERDGQLFQVDGRELKPVLWAQEVLTRKILNAKDGKTALLKGANKDAFKALLSDGSDIEIQSWTQSWMASLPKAKRDRINAAVAREVKQRQGIARSWIKVRDASVALINGEMSNVEDGSLEGLRETLNAEFDRHVREHGHVSASKRNSHRFLLEDPEYSLVQSLEDEIKDVNEEGNIVPRYEKAAIMSERVLRLPEPPESAESIEEAVAAAMGNMGGINLPYMARLLGVSERDVRDQLIEQNLAYLNPINGTVEVADLYLSGNVARKLREAKSAAADQKVYEKNVTALEKVIPEAITIDRIAINPGARWVSDEVYTEFMREELGHVEGAIKFVKGANLFSFENHDQGGSDELSTEEKTAGELFEAALNNRPIRISDSVSGGGSVFNPTKTAEANRTMEAVKNRFSEWTQTTEHEINGTKVPQMLESQFNDQVNGVVPPTFIGDWVTLPGQSGEIYIKNRPHRRAVIARMLTTGFGMMAHGVGSGKTYNQIALAMEMRRLGKARKPLILVQNSTVKQFAASFRKAYPQAKLLVADSDNFSAERRSRFKARVATGDWDAVILTHSNVSLVSHEESSVSDYFARKIAELEAALVEVEGDRQSQRDIQKVKDALEERMTKMLDKIQARADNSLTWEQMGVDALIVDEAHEFKNAPVVTRMGRIKNMPSGQASDRAVMMEMKVLDVQRRMNGKNVFFATGTPITNTMAEAYVMMNYVAPHVLREAKILNFDDFATMFGKTVTKPEATWKGNIESVTRFAKFTNGPSLVNLIRTAFDVALGNEKLGLRVPAVKGGAPLALTIEPTEVNTVFNEWVIDTAARFEAIDNKKEAFEQDPWLQAIPIMVMQAGMAQALDPRLINPNVPDDPNSKVNTMVDKLVKIYEQGDQKKTAQVIFSDLQNPFSTNLLEAFNGNPFEEFGVDEEIRSLGQRIVELSAAARDDAEVKRVRDRLKTEYDKKVRVQFNLFDDIKAKILAKGVGIKASEIAVVKASMSKDTLTSLFDKVNEGKIRVVIGSTAKLGVGVNMQERLAAVHHLGPPRDFKPAMMEQRNGRILRQGNLHRDWADLSFISEVERAAGEGFKGKKIEDRFQEAADWLDRNDKDGSIEKQATAMAEEHSINIITYGLAKSMDSAVYSMMAAKQGFIEQILMGENVHDEFDDPASAEAASFAMIAATTMGDANLIRKVEIDTETSELTIDRSAFFRKLASHQRQVNWSKDSLRSSYTETELSRLEDRVEKYEGLFDRRTKTKTTTNKEGKKETKEVQSPEYKFGERTVDTKKDKILDPLGDWLEEEQDKLENTKERVVSLGIDVNGMPFRVSLERIEKEAASFAMIAATTMGDANLIRKVEGNRLPPDGIIYLPGGGRYSRESVRFTGSAGVVMALRRIAAGVKDNVASFKEQREFHRKRAVDSQTFIEEMGDPPHKEKLEALQEELREVEAKLREGAQNPTAHRYFTALARAYGEDTAKIIAGIEEGALDLTPDDYATIKARLRLPEHLEGKEDVLLFIRDSVTPPPPEAPPAQEEEFEEDVEVTRSRRRDPGSPGVGLIPPNNDALQTATPDPAEEADVQAALQGVPEIMAKVFEAMQDPAADQASVASQFGLTEVAVNNIERVMQNRIRKNRKNRGQSDSEVSSLPGARPALDLIAKHPEDRTIANPDTPIGFPKEVRPLSSMALSRLLRIVGVDYFAAGIKKGGPLGQAISKVVDESKHPEAVKLREKIWQNPDLALTVLAHEIGHVIDYIPANVIGPGLARRLAPLGNYETVFPFFDSLPKNKDGNPSRRALEKAIKEELRALSMAWRGDYELSDEYRDSAPELYADFMSAVLNYPNWASKVAPHSWRAFTEATEQKPEFADAWMTIQTLMESDLMAEAAQSDSARGRQEMFKKIVDGIEKNKKTDSERKRRWAQWKEVNINRFARAAEIDPERGNKLESVQQWEAGRKGEWNRQFTFETEKVLKAHGIDGEQFHWYLMNHRIQNETTDTLNFLRNDPEGAREMLKFVFESFEGTFANEWVDLWRPRIESASNEELYKTLAMASFDLQAIKEDVDSLLDKLVQEGEESFPKSFKEFFNAWNVRAFMANPNGITVEDAANHIEELRGELGEHAFEILENTASALSTRFYRLMVMARNSGLISKEVFNEKIAPNAGVYVPFQVSAYFMPDEVRASILKQKGTDKNIVDISTVMNIQAHKWISRIARQKEATLLKEIGEIHGIPVVSDPITQYKRRQNMKNEVVWFSDGKAHSVRFPSGQLRFAAEAYNLSREISADGLLELVAGGTNFFKMIWTKWSPAFTLWRSPVREFWNVFERGGVRGVGQVFRPSNWADAINYSMAVIGKAQLNPRNKKRLAQTKLMEPSKYTHVQFQDSQYAAAFREDTEIAHLAAEANARGIGRLRPMMPKKVLAGFDKMMSVLSFPSATLDSIAAATDALSKIAVDQNLKMVNVKRRKKGKEPMTRERMVKLVKFTALPNAGAEGGTGQTRKVLIPFYRTAWQGLRAMRVWSGDDAVGMGYTLRVMIGTVLPKLLMWYAASGMLRNLLVEMFGEPEDDDEDVGGNLQKFYDFIPEYQKATEFIIPMYWVDGEGEIRGLGTKPDQIGLDWTPVGIRMVLSDEARLIGPLAWAAAKKFSPETNDHQLPRDLITTAITNVPPLTLLEPGMGNPVLAPVTDAMFLGMGINPPDPYRRKGKFREDDEFKANPWKVYGLSLLSDVWPLYNWDVRMSKEEPAEKIEKNRNWPHITGVFSITGSSANQSRSEHKSKSATDKLKAKAKIHIKKVDPEAYEFLKLGASSVRQKVDERNSKERYAAALYGPFYNNYWNPGRKGQGAEARLMEAIDAKDWDEVKEISEQSAFYLKRAKDQLDAFVIKEKATAP